MIDPKNCTVIIPHLGGTPESEFALDECLKSLQETSPEGLKIVLALNGDKCQKHDGEIRIKSQGQCKAVNSAVAMTNTEWIMITNDDMIYKNLWWNKLTDNLSNEVYCVSPQLVEPIQGAPSFIRYFCGGAGGDFNKQKWIDFSENYKGEGLRTGFNLPFLIKRDLWDMVQGYDISYDPYGSNSDSDLEYKIRLAGVQPMQNTNCIVYHFSQTSGTFFPENSSYWGKNWQYFIDKWGFPRTDDGIWEANFVMPDKERIFRPEWEGKYL
jgi:GT2 family glycosyltransferase